MDHGPRLCKVCGKWHCLAGCVKCAPPVYLAFDDDHCLHTTCFEGLEEISEQPTLLRKVQCEGIRGGEE